MGGGIGMGNTCKPMAVSFQCMTKFTTNKKKSTIKKRTNSEPKEIKCFVFNYFHLADIYGIPITHQSPGDPRVKYKQKSCSYGSKHLPHP